MSFGTIAIIVVTIAHAWLLFWLFAGLRDELREERRRRSGPVRSHPPAVAHSGTSAAPPDSAAAATGHASASSAATDDRAAPPDAQPATTLPATWSAPRTWSDFAQQLQTIKGRVDYARSARDRRLSREAARDLQTCLQSWCETLQDRLAATSTTTDAAADDEPDQAALEMCLAQFETTVTNIQSWDWTDSVESCLADLERELIAIERSRRSVVVALA